MTLWREPIANLPDIGKFIKHDKQRFIVGSLANQIRTLLQRMKMRGYKPWKILLNRGLRYALYLEMSGKMGYKRTDSGDFFNDLPIVVDDTVEEPIILIRPEIRKDPLEKGQSTWGKKGSYASR